MDKYQQYYIDSVICKSVEKVFKCVYAEGGEEVCGEINFEDLTLTVNQVEDITVTRYRAVLKGLEVYFFNGVEVNYGDGWEKLEYKLEEENGTYRRAYYEIPLDFEKRVKEVKLVPAGGIADAIVLKVIFNEADKELYYKKKAEADRSALIKRAHIECASCVSAIQVFFVPCNGEDYGHSEVTLYRGTDQFMNKYESAPGVFCITALGLGYGDYSVVYRQYDKNKKLLFETDKVEVTVDSTPKRKDIY